MNFQGYPDNAAEWANQFAHFCMPPDGQFHCVAVSWLTMSSELDPGKVSFPTTDHLRTQNALLLIKQTMEQVSLDARSMLGCMTITIAGGV